MFMTVPEQLSHLHMAEVADSLPSEKPPFPIIGIGASVGGITALEQFFAYMPPDSGMAFVVILHLSPDYESEAVLSELM
jgi:chemotaxis response regulator CheB